MYNYYCPLLTFFFSAIGFNPTTYTATEGVDSHVILTLFRTGNANFTGNVTLITAPVTANGTALYMYPLRTCIIISFTSIMQCGTYVAAYV